VTAKGLRPDLLLVRRGGAVEYLRVPALLMGAVTGARNWLYDKGCLPMRRVQLPIVSVGNVTVGGTGKTPMVAWTLRALQERGFHPGVLSRGYKSKQQNEGSDGLNDEGRLFARMFPGVPQVQMPDRVAGARQLESLGADAILLDDGFQHRRLARDVDLVLIDAMRPWGLPAQADGAPSVRALLPRGLMRESLASLCRASAIVITRSDALGASELEALEGELQAFVPGVVRLLGEHRPSGLRRYQADGTEQELGLRELAGRNVALVSGIGNPEAFERTARNAGALLESVHAFPDHHPFKAAELEPIAQKAEMLVTSKDSVKLLPLGIPHLVLEVEFAITRGEGVLAAILDSLPRSQQTLERDALH
jgi:tetraacyldisaccharide 4'-kinase